MSTNPQEQAMADQAAIDDQDLYDDFGADLHDELPPRPRRKLLTPVPLALLAVLIAAAGFISGVLVQKQQQDAGAGGPAGGLPDFASAQAGAEGAGGGPGGGASGSAPGAGDATVGEVSSVKGKTLYVTDAQGNTIAVKTSSASEVTRTAESQVRAIKPGDTVIVQGSERDDGSVRASSITATGAGVQSAFPQFGRQGQPGGTVQSLFE
jgi:Domain of unknown function (DUF5666)